MRRILLILGLLLLVGCVETPEICNILFENETHYCNEYHRYERKPEIVCLVYMDNDTVFKIPFKTKEVAESLCNQVECECELYS